MSKNMVTTRQANGNSALEIAQSNQELVTKDRGHRRKLWIGIAVVVIVLVVVAVAAIIITASNKDPGISDFSRQGRPSISLDDFLEGRLIPRSFNGTWISDTELLYRSDADNIMIHNVATRENKVLLPAGFLPPGTFDYELSADRKYLLLAHNYQKMHSRYSYLAHYTIVDVDSRRKVDLKAQGSERQLQAVQWSPKGNAIVYVYGNNIYYRPSVLVPSEVQITGDGILGTVFNGVADWVYEEEVLGSSKTIWFSPSGKMLAWIQLNDTEVGVMDIPIYGQPGVPEFQYTKNILLHYPKAGTPNPVVIVQTVDLDAIANFRLMPVPLSLPVPKSLGKEPICSAVGWANDSQLVTVWLNREQNQAEIMSCDPGSFKCDAIISVQETEGWVEMFESPIFSRDGSRLLLIMSHDQGSAYGGYRHLTLVQHKPRAKPIALTKGRFVVTSILKWDEKKEIVYFLATTEANSAVRHLYSVSTAPTNSTSAMTCHTCSVKTINFNRHCMYNNALFSRNSSYYVHTCDGPSVSELRIFDRTDRAVETWETNEQLVELVKTHSTPDNRLLEVPLADGFTAKVMLQIPPGIDSSGDVKYPLLINVYGGPDSVSVVDKFTLNWFSYLVTNKSIIVATIDGRGTGNRGDRVSFATYKKLGTVEVVDQINVTRYLQNTYSFIDPKRTAIWGWSYGGYVSAMALAMDDFNVFKCGISIAPVTDWTLYDSIYVERFMGSPNLENIGAYKRGALLNKLEKFRNKKYLLIHGTLDDNVHYQQSMLLAKGLELNDIQFRQQTYPDEDHSLSSVRRHLYHTFESFLDECYTPTSDS